ncbi:MAG: hypothetical protein HYY37_03350 [Candidatus Aenigmarchaeota archaeon]|nr:hypothetical protein [Candidatus Aenigmarchaeota archaeon]
MNGGTALNSGQMIVNISVAVTTHVNFIRVTFIERNTASEGGSLQYVAVSEWVTDSNSVVTGGAQVRSVVGCPQIPRSARSTRSWSRCGQ